MIWPNDVDDLDDERWNGEWIIISYEDNLHFQLNENHSGGEELKYLHWKTSGNMRSHILLILIHEQRISYKDALFYKQKGFF